MSSGFSVPVRADCLLPAASFFIVCFDLFLPVFGQRRAAADAADRLGNDFVIEGGAFPVAIVADGAVSPDPEMRSGAHGIDIPERRARGGSADRTAWN